MQSRPVDLINLIENPESLPVTPGDVSTALNVWAALLVPTTSTATMDTETLSPIATPHVKRKKNSDSDSDYTPAEIKGENLSKRQADQTAPLKTKKPRPPVTDEELMDRREKQLLKNRVSAQLSRQRKKSHVEELENTVLVLQEANKALETELAELRALNAQLKLSLSDAKTELASIRPSM